MCLLPVPSPWPRWKRSHRKGHWNGIWGCSVCFLQPCVKCGIKAVDSLQRGQTAADRNIWTSALWAKLQQNCLTWLFLRCSLSGSVVLLTEFGFLWPRALAHAASAFVFFLTAVCVCTFLLYQGTLCLLTKCFPTGNFLWWKTLGKLPVGWDAAGGR